MHASPPMALAAQLDHFDQNPETMRMHACGMPPSRHNRPAWGAGISPRHQPFSVTRL